jgi:hypothetical protein
LFTGQDKLRIVQRYQLTDSGFVGTGPTAMPAETRDSASVSGSDGSQQFAGLFLLLF